MKLELENEKLQEKLNTYEATEVEETKAPSILSMKLNLISGQRFRMTPSCVSMPNLKTGHESNRL